MNPVLKFRVFNILSKLEDHLIWLSIIFTGLIIYLGSELVTKFPFDSPPSAKLIAQGSAAILLVLVWIGHWFSRRWFEKSASFKWFKRVQSNAFNLNRKLGEFLVKVKEHQTGVSFLDSEVNSVASGHGKLVDRESNRGGWVLREHVLIDGAVEVNLLGATLSIVDKIETHFGPTSTNSVTTANKTFSGELVNYETSSQIEHGYFSIGSAIVSLAGANGLQIDLKFDSSSRAQEVFDEIARLVADQSKINRTTSKTLADLQAGLEDLRGHLPGQEVRIQISEVVKILGEELSNYLGGEPYEVYRELLAEAKNQGIL